MIGLSLVDVSVTFSLRCFNVNLASVKTMSFLRLSAGSDLLSANPEIFNYSGAKGRRRSGTHGRRSELIKRCRGVVSWLISVSASSAGGPRERQFNKFASQAKVGGGATNGRVLETDPKHRRAQTL